MEEMTGFALSQEELLAALVLEEFRAPLGFDDLETRVFGGFPVEVRAALLAAAERSLIARGIVEPQGETARVEAEIAALLRTCTEPERTWIVLHQATGQPSRRSYFHQREERLVAHIEAAGIHQFLPLDGPQAIGATLVELIAPIMTEELPAASEGGILPEATFAKLLDSPTRPTVEDLHRALRGAGWGEELAQTFAEAMAQLVSLTALSRYHHTVGAEAEQAFTVVRGASSQWLITAYAPEMIHLRPLPGESLVQTLAAFGHLGVEAHPSKVS